MSRTEDKNEQQGHHTAKKRRQYSKTGCVECKRRKVKCDETKPNCWQCSHLSKKCVYRTAEFQFRASSFSEGPILKSRRKNSMSRDVPMEEDYDSKSSLEIKFINEVSPLTIGGTVDSSMQEITNSDDLNALLNDALILANDLFSGIPETAANCDTPNTPIFDQWTEIEAALDGISDLELYYLKIFYYKASYWLMPLAPSADSNICNHILFHHLIRANKSKEKDKSYLQSSMVSISAKYMFNVEGEQKHNSIRTYYLRKSLKQLYQEFESMSGEKTLCSQVESLILCVLLLTLDSSTFRTQEWKVHLRGAKDLFIKYIMTELNEGDNDLVRMKTAELARAWFSAIAAVASISKAGSFCNETELDKILDMESYAASTGLLKKMGFLTDNGFNLFFGYSTAGISLLKEVMRVLDQPVYRDDNNDNFLLVCSLLQASREYQCYPNKNGKIDLQQFEQLKINPIESTLVHYNDQKYSICDSIQQTHLEALFGTYLLKCIKLPINSTLVQNSCKRAWDVIEWIFSDCSLTSKEAALLNQQMKTGEIRSYNDIKKLPIDLVSKCIMEPLRNDFRLMMFQTGIVMCVGKLLLMSQTAINLIRCKVLAYLIAMADNLGAASAKVSADYLIRKWYPVPTHPRSEDGDSFSSDAALPFS